MELMAHKEVWVHHCNIIFIIFAEPQCHGTAKLSQGWGGGREIQPRNSKTGLQDGLGLINRTIHVFPCTCECKLTADPILKSIKTSSPSPETAVKHSQEVDRTLAESEAGISAAFPTNAFSTFSAASLCCSARSASPGGGGAGGNVIAGIKKPELG